MNNTICCNTAYPAKAEQKIASTRWLTKVLRRCTFPGVEELSKTK